MEGEDFRTLRRYFEDDTGNNDDSESPIYSYIYKDEYIEWLEGKLTELYLRTDVE